MMEEENQNGLSAEEAQDKVASVHFVVATCENMITDILTASNGKTIEVNNTDAKERLTLADALVYNCNQGVEKIVDLATLTGACVVALGPSVAEAAAGEKLWRFPLEEIYWDP